MASPHLHHHPLSPHLHHQPLSPHLRRKLSTSLSLSEAIASPLDASSLPQEGPPPLTSPPLKTLISQCQISHSLVRRPSNESRLENPTFIWLRASLGCFLIRPMSHFTRVMTGAPDVALAATLSRLFTDPTPPLARQAALLDDYCAQLLSVFWKWSFSPSMKMINKRILYSITTGSICQLNRLLTAHLQSFLLM